MRQPLITDSKNNEPPTTLKSISIKYFLSSSAATLAETGKILTFFAVFLI